MISIASLTKTKDIAFYVSNAVRSKKNKVRIGVDDRTKCDSDESKEDQR